MVSDSLLEIVDYSCNEVFAFLERFRSALWSIVSPRILGVWQKIGYLEIAETNSKILRYFLVTSDYFSRPTRPVKCQVFWFLHSVMVTLDPILGSATINFPKSTWKWKIWSLPALSLRWIFGKTLVNEACQVLLMKYLRFISDTKLGQYET